MARERKIRRLGVWMNGERVGDWHLARGHGHEFVYAESWVGATNTRPISLSLPLRVSQEPYRKGVQEFFDNLLPDNRQIRERIQRRFAARSSAAFDLLLEIGRDCVGALQLVPEGNPPPDVQRITGTPLTAGDIEKLLIGAVGPRIGREEENDDSFRISIAGAQEKTALLWHNGGWLQPSGATPTTHILKLPIGTNAPGIDLSTSVENEWLCAQITEQFGIQVAKCRMETFGEQKALVVDRFDRKLARDEKWYLRLPQEDFCQATGKSPDEKYESEGGPGIDAIMEILQNSERAAEDQMDFMRTQVVFWMLAAIDGHAKNFSIYLLPKGAYQLTPRYDILSAYPVLGHGRGKLAPERIKMAMSVKGKSRHYVWTEIHARHWIETAKRHGITNMNSIVEDLVAKTPAVIDRVRSLLPTDFPSQIAETILAGLRSRAEQLKAEL
jgi:serine/threonine-protein kinase HipA